MSGKGSAPRPIPDWDTFSKNFDRIFGNVEQKREHQEVDVGAEKVEIVERDRGQVFDNPKNGS